MAGLRRSDPRLAHASAGYNDVKLIRSALVASLFAVLPDVAHAAASANYTGHWTGVSALVAFGFAGALMLSSAGLELRRSKAMMLAAGVIWLFVALAYGMHGDEHGAGAAARASLLELAELFLFVLVLMTYVNAMEERGLFAVLRSQLLEATSSLRAQYWLTGLTAFSIAPLIGDLTTAMVMTSMVLAMSGGDRRFAGVACINVVVAVNAGGACSPFGDLTTLVTWQRGTVDLYAFFELCIPAFVAWLVPAAIMSRTLPVGVANMPREPPKLERGALVVMGFFAVTIAVAAIAHELLHLPAVIGMLTGLALLAMWGYALKRRELSARHAEDADFAATALDLDRVLREEARVRRAPLDLYVEVQRADWDTLLYCYGAVLCVGGLSALGYAALGSDLVHGASPQPTETAVFALASGAVDNLLGALFALKMAPGMSTEQTLFTTLAFGIGGSLLSIGSAAGILAMRRARDVYTFGAHLRWSWAIALGYAAGLGTHALMNGSGGA
jgi:Na+/H+ antiporter NhaD/arsenite permease-like protein